MSLRNYAVQRNEHKKSSSLHAIHGPIDTNKDSKLSVGGLDHHHHVTFSERLPSATTSRRSVPLLVTGTQITRSNEHLTRTRIKHVKTQSYNPRSEEGPSPLSLPKIIQHSSTSDLSGFKAGSAIPNGPQNLPGPTSVKRASKEDRTGSFRENYSFRPESATNCSQDQRSFLQTSSIKCLPSDGKSLPSKCRTTSTSKISAIFPSLQTGSEFKSDLSFEHKYTELGPLGRNFIQSSNNKIIDSSDPAVERRRLDVLNLTGAEHKELIMGDCSLDDLSNEFVDRIMKRTMSAMKMKKVFDEVWPQFLRNFVEETLNDFENMSEHMKVAFSKVMDDS